jgi:hypothetical protein
MSWLFSQALVEAFSVATCSAGEPCAQLNLMATAQPFLRNDKPMEFSRFSQFGLTCAPLTDDRGEALLTWYRAGFPARTSAPQDQGTALTELAADCGASLRGSFAKYDHDERTWKTHQSSLLGDYTEFSETWPNWGWMRDGVCWELPMSERPILETESGLLPTPATVDTGSLFNQSASEGAALRPTLGAMARFNLWPTPTVCGNYNRKGASKTSGDGLATAVQMHPTPCARDHRGVHRSERSQERRQESKRGVPLNEHVGGLLNPTWVEWLMGWPIGWTALQPLGMDRFREWQQQHGGCS